MNLESLNSQQKFRQELLASLDQQQFPNFTPKQPGAAVQQPMTNLKYQQQPRTPPLQGKKQGVEEEKSSRPAEVANDYPQMFDRKSQREGNQDYYFEEEEAEEGEDEGQDPTPTAEMFVNDVGMTNIVTSPTSQLRQQPMGQHQRESSLPPGGEQGFTVKPYSEEGLTSIQEVEQEIRKKRAYIWSFGKNGDGELGISSQKDQFLPRPIQQTLKLSQSAKWISSGSHHSAIVTKAGELYVCGSQLHGKLGIPSVNVMHLTRFSQVSLSSSKVKQVACGDYHTLALLEDGQVFAWGGTLHKKVGEKSSNSQNNEPRPVPGLLQKTIVFIDCGDFHSLALEADGSLYTWGGGGAAYNKGQCGHGNNEDNEQPMRIETLAHKRVVAASAGGFHTLALTEDNELYAWGSGTYGECGLGEFQSTSRPKLVKMPAKEFVSSGEANQFSDEFDFMAAQQQQGRPQIISISAGGHHSLVLTSKGRVYSFGYGSHGQLGLRTTKNYCTPQLVKDLLSKCIAHIAAGWNHSLVLTDRGDLFASGYGNHGQLGLNDKESRTSFTHVGSLGGKNVYRIFAGGNHSWVAIDDVIPVRTDYRPPSPVAYPESTSPLQMSPRNRTTMSKQVSAQAKRKYEVGLHVTYTDTSMCHRFITFEVPKAGGEEARAKESLDDFIRGLYRDDQGLLYHKVQEGLDENSPQTPFQEIGSGGQEERYYTVCLIFDPEKSQTFRPFMQKLMGQNRMLKQQQMNSSGSKMVYFEESDLTGNQMEYSLGSWVFEFSQKVGEKFCVRKPRFSELRPTYLKPN